MQHPLENPSLTPYSFLFPFSYMRVRQKLETNMINGDHEIVKFWAKQNRNNSQRPLPAKVILHDILPSLSSQVAAAKQSFTFDGLPYHNRDIALLSSMVRWFGTNIGNSFITSRYTNEKYKHPVKEFVEKFNQLDNSDIILGMAIHSCTVKCKNNTIDHAINTSLITDRDRLVVKALLIWLGKEQGRDFMNAYKSHIRKLHDKKISRSMNKNWRAA